MIPEAINFTPAQWTRVRENPRQRDTARHALKMEKHLQVAVPQHSVVAAARLPSGELVKLDGHTRDLLWQEGRIPVPHVIMVLVFLAADMAEVKQMYEKYDNSLPVETKADKICGAFREHDVYPKSSILQRGALSYTLGMAELAITGSVGASSRGVDPYVSVNAWRDEIILLDRTILGHGTRRLHSGILAAILLTLRKRGAYSVDPFWELYLDPDESGGIRDPHNVLLNHLYRRQAMRTTGGRDNTRAITEKALSACEHYLAGNLVKSLTGIDITKYLTISDSALSSTRLATRRRNEAQKEANPSV